MKVNQIKLLEEVFNVKPTDKILSQYDYNCMHKLIKKTYKLHHKLAYEKHLIKCDTFQEIILVLKSGGDMQKAFYTGTKITIDFDRIISNKNTDNDDVRNNVRQYLENYIRKIFFDIENHGFVTIKNFVYFPGRKQYEFNVKVYKPIILVERLNDVKTSVDLFPAPKKLLLPMKLKIDYKSKAYKKYIQEYINI